MKPVKKIEDLIRKIEATPRADMDKQILIDIIEAQEKTNKRDPDINKPGVWRIMMKSSITKLAAASVIIIAAAIPIMFIAKSTQPAWAVEQSIEAMKFYNSIYFSGKVSKPLSNIYILLKRQIPPEAEFETIDFEMWARANPQQTKSEKVKFACSNLFTAVAQDQQAYIQFPDSNTYNIEGEFFRVDPWPTTELLNFLKEKSNIWKEQYGVDAETGKDRIFIYCNSLDKNKSWWAEFDLETKLLVHLKQWQNAHWKGTPEFDISKIIYYEQLPDEIFNLNEPTNTIKITTPLFDPNSGLNIEDGTTRQEACEQILTSFWQAVIDGNYTMVRRLMPGLANQTDEQLYHNFGKSDGISELVEIGILQQGDVESVVIVPCTVQFEKGKKYLIDLLIKFRDINGQKSCVIQENKGKPREIN
ncbi:MAG: hypothetical protein ABFD79_09410 [Phycisphaerales bacterium]